MHTDHRSLEWLDHLKSDNARLARRSLALQPFQYTVVHRPGKANANADALLRPPANAQDSQFDVGKGRRDVKD